MANLFQTEWYLRKGWDSIHGWGSPPGDGWMETCLRMIGIILGDRPTLKVVQCFCKFTHRIYY